LWIESYNGSSTTVTIPAKINGKAVTGVYTGAFPDIVTTINVDKNNTHLCSIDGVLFSKNKKILLMFPSARGGKYSVPDGVTNIRSGAFRFNKNITEIVLPDTIAEIGSTAFYGCQNLAKINIPQSLKTVGDGAFSDSVGISALGEKLIQDLAKRFGNGIFESPW
jgi:hypothetical protein